MTKEESELKTGKKLVTEEEIEQSFKEVLENLKRLDEQDKPIKTITEKIKSIISNVINLLPKVNEEDEKTINNLINKKETKPLTRRTK